MARIENKMNTLKYNGFVGTVNYSEEDEVFFGKVEGINGLVNFEGSSVSALKKAFHESVDEYVAYCEEKGIVPEKTYNGVFNVRISPEIHRKVAMMAAAAGTTINNVVRQVLEKTVGGNMAH